MGYQLVFFCEGVWQEVFNIDVVDYGGCGVGNFGMVVVCGRENGDLIVMVMLFVFLMLWLCYQFELYVFMVNYG